ncbi:MAG: hypothetical protein H6Q74_2324 [Firmicutes bacterium]|nr:hypothetical protein [Bacillota bacterium]
MRLVFQLVQFAIIVFPFNGLPYFQDILKELSPDASVYPFIIALFIWLMMFLMGIIKLIIPMNVTFKLLLLFIFWSIVSGISNMAEINENIFKGRTGIEKYVGQIGVLLFVSLLFLLIYNVCIKTKKPLLEIRKSILISFIIVGMYSVIEILYLNGNSSAQTVLESINPFIRDEGTNSLGQYGLRLRSVAFEPSHFAMYCSFAFPWLLSYIITENRKLWPYLCSIYMLLLMLLTNSRFCYVIGSVQLLLFISKLKITYRINYRSLIGTLILINTVVMISCFLVSDDSLFSIINTILSLLDSDNSSNIARYGSQVTAIRMVLDYPIVGVGLGQFGFYMADYVPSWACYNPEIISYLANIEGTHWPTVHSLYPRIAAELGFPGLFIWLIMWANLISGCIRRYYINLKIGHQTDAMGLTIILSISGVVFSGWNYDSIRFFGYWLMLGFGMYYINSKTEISQKHP